MYIYVKILVFRLLILFTSMFGARCLLGREWAKLLQTLLRGSPQNGRIDMLLFSRFISLLMSSTSVVNPKVGGS